MSHLDYSTLDDETLVQLIVQARSEALGEVIRTIAGLALILIGLLVVGDIWGWVLAIVGLVPPAS
jgi:hypothetical protein